MLMHQVKELANCAYAVMIAAFCVPCFFRLKFANRMLKALDTNDQFLLNSALRQLKIFTKYMGIVTLVIVILVIVSFVYDLSFLAK